MVTLGLFQTGTEENAKNSKIARNIKSFKMKPDQKTAVNLKKTLKKVKEIFPLLVGDLKNEMVLFFLINNKGQVVQWLAYKGSKKAVTFKPSFIVKKMAENYTPFLIMLHNHPSGLLKASIADVALTCTLTALLSEQKMTLIDHLIFSNEGFYSLRQNNLI